MAPNTFGQDVSTAGSYGSPVPTAPTPSIPMGGGFGQTGSQLPPVGQTMDANALSQNQNSSGMQFPTNAPDASKVASNTNSANASIPSTIPSAESVINAGAAPTPAETKQKSILDRIAGLVGGDKGKQTLTNEAESAGGVPGLTKSVNDLNTQLQGLNDQATALAYEANYTIPNQVQLDNQGSGVTKASTAARSADALRMNQIKQGAVATQSLTVKAALYGAQGNLTLAKDAADKAATAQYEKQQQDIDYQKAQLDALAPSLSKEEKAQAALTQVQLADGQTQIDNAKEDKKTIIAMATATMKNNPNDHAAQYAAQQAIQESNQQQPNLQKALALVGQYQDDNTKAAVLDRQLKNQQILEAQANVKKINNEIKNSQPLVATGDNAPLINAFNFAATGLTSAQQAQTKQTFVSLMNSGDADGARSYVLRTAISNLSSTEQTTTIGRTQAIAALGDVQQLLRQAQAKGIDTNLITGNITNVAQKLGATNNPDLTYISSRIQQELQVYRRALTGVAFSPAESAQYSAIFPDITNTDQLNTTKISALLDGLNSNNRSVLSSYIGDRNYDALFGAAQTATLPSNKSSSKEGDTHLYNGQTFKLIKGQWVQQ